MDKMYEDVKQMVSKEITKITSKPEMSPTDLEQLGEMIDIIKDICMIDTDYDMPSGASRGVMPYWGSIQYEDRPNTNRTSYGRMGRYNDNSSYGRYDGYDNRMMPREW